MRVAAYTRVHADRIAAYEAHREAAGLERLPRDVARQARTAGLLDVAHDCSGRGADANLPVVGELP
ncbi:hypothetical protein [Streptomyces sp. NPDC058335]|uniref:hypothetical protein n=1 Tax=Streptomyces sp. NPDC058335 TaxID=3346451 RepID=UPI0036662D9C